MELINAGNNGRSSVLRLTSSSFSQGLPDTVAEGEYGSSWILQEVPDCDMHEAGMTWKVGHFLGKYPGSLDPCATTQSYIR